MGIPNNWVDDCIKLSKDRYELISPSVAEIKTIQGGALIKIRGEMGKVMQFHIENGVIKHVKDITNK